ncbi:hypothetical protein [Thermoplasma sp.]|uniref:hypothetical protein n=1 Tax=Thermoplasma sp. TaxID=1973142 RepID=UPI001276FDB9|nr:hypothetical protein [Thermoplasma sp.]KAA8922291.1 MAG: hypothetical protein F6Q11_05265 [Thermoplasma sp.]
MSLLSQLDNLSKITPEDIEIMQKLSRIAQKLQKLGLLDVVEGVLDDDRTIGAIASFLTSDTMLEILVNRDNLIKLIALLSKNETYANLSAILEKLS